MGWVDDDTAYSAQAFPEGGAPEAGVSPTFTQTWGAAFRSNNDVVSVARRLMRENYPPEEGYHPLKDIEGTKYLANYARNFTGARSKAETEAIKARIDQEEEDRRVNELSGVSGVFANLAAGIASPLTFLPGGALVKVGGGGYSALRSAAVVGAMAGAQTALQEGALQTTQETRTLQESLHTVGAATLMGGLLGAGAARWATRAERASMEAGIDALRNDLMGGTASLSSAATDARDMTLVGTGKVAELINKTPGLKQVIGSPMARIFLGDSLVAKRAAADLAETALEFEQAKKGITTSRGVPLDALVANETGRLRDFWQNTLDDLWTKHYYDTTQAPIFAGVRADLAERFGTAADGKLTKGAFNEAVSEALRNGNVHEIPQVQEAARAIRTQVLNPWAERMQKAGILPDDITVDEAGNYLHRVYDRQTFATRRPDAVKLFADWLEDDQAVKAGIQSRLVFLNNSLGYANENIAKINAKIASLEADAEVAAARAEEATRVNKFAFQRAGALREGQFVNEGGVAVPAPGKNIQKAQGGAVFETKVRGRGNELNDRITAKLGEIDDLKDRLVRETEMHDLMRSRIEAEISAWQGKSASDAKSALKTREKAAAARPPTATGRLTSADATVDDTVRKILASDRNKARPDLEARANEIIDRIDVGPVGRLPYDEGGGGPRMGPPGKGADARGPMAERVFHIPDNYVSKDGSVRFTDFTENDIEKVLSTYVRSVIPDTLIHERFGDVEMKMVFKEIRDEYAAKINAATSEKERLRLRDQRNEIEAQLAGIRDRVRHTYGYSPDKFSQNAARVAGFMKNYNAVTDLGGAMVSSIVDAAGTIYRYGMLSTFGNGWMPFISHMVQMGADGKSGYGLMKSQLRSIGLAAETLNASRMRDLDEIADFVSGRSLPERAAHVMGEKMQLLNGLAPWTDAMKTIAGTVASHEILMATKAVAEGKATAKHIKKLANSNIDQSMAGRIWQAWSKDGGGVVDGVHLPNTAQWADKEARDFFDAALRREVNIAVIQPGQEKPLWFSRPAIGLIAQHKSFAAASTERILLAGLQRRDAAVLQGLVMAMSLGALSRFSYSVVSGKDLPETPEQWVKEALDRSGVLGSLQEVNSMAAKATGGLADVHRLYGAGQPLSRYASRSLISSALGPTAGKVENLIGVTGAMGSEIQRRFGSENAEGWSASDSTKLRRLMPYQNLFYIRRLLDKVEEGANGWAGLD